MFVRQPARLGALLQQLSQPLFLEPRNLALRKVGTAQQVAHQRERLWQLRGERRERQRSDVPVGVRVDRRADALEPVGERRPIHSCRSLEQQIHRECGDPLLSRGLGRGARLDHREHRDERQLAHRCDDEPQPVR